MRYRDNLSAQEATDKSPLTARKKATNQVFMVFVFICSLFFHFYAMC